MHYLNVSMWSGKCTYMFLIADTHVHCVSLCGSGTYPRPELRTAGGGGDFGCPVGVGGTGGTLELEQL